MMSNYDVPENTEIIKPLPVTSTQQVAGVPSAMQVLQIRDTSAAALKLS